MNGYGWFVAAFLAELLLCGASLVTALCDARPSGWGWVLLLPALGFAAINLHLGLVRPWLHLRRTGSYVGYRHISGFPVVGGLLAVAAVVASFGDLPVAVGACLTIAVDRGGLPYFWRRSGTQK